MRSRSQRHAATVNVDLLMVLVLAALVVATAAYVVGLTHL